MYGFIDEHEKGIDAGAILLEQPAWVFKDDTTDYWNNLPADRHRQGCNLSFLDGHVEHWRWQAPKIYPPGGGGKAKGGDLVDHRRLQQCLPHDVLR